MFAYAFTFLAALAVTFILTPAVKNFAVQIGAVDKPDARKVHHGLVPRLGGLAIYAGFMVSVILTVGFTYEMTGIMIGATCLVFVGIADDIVSLPAKVKLLGQILSAAVLVIFFDVNIDWIDLPYVGIIEFPLFVYIRQLRINVSERPVCQRHRIIKNLQKQDQNPASTENCKPLKQNAPCQTTIKNEA